MFSKKPNANKGALSGDPFKEMAPEPEKFIDLRKPT